MIGHKAALVYNQSTQQITSLSHSIDPASIFPFELDDFQKEATKCLSEGKSILVCAPTGAGKTLIAEYAMHLALAHNKRIFYTTPLKALSNQKFFDLGNQFGQDRVGLLTGDIQINREADILVLTTEIFRNMLYKSDQEKELFERIGFVVLDECHYMKDPDRGTVWEESIIYCPQQAQIIGLSATVGNPEQLRDWIESVHGETALIQSHKRPVPLRFFFFGREGLKPLKTSEGKINPKVLKETAHSKAKNSRSRAEAAKHLPNMLDTIRELKARDMLPTIYFLFSRRGCETAMQRISNSNLNLLNDKEQRSVDEELGNACAQLPWLKEHPHFYGLKKGAAAHHAGLLPAIKTIVERLFQKNLLKVVFATETLAAGINMPARSVVISQISKRADSGHRLLSGSEFLQMGGRAGRRGMDEIGYVIVLETPFEGAMEVGRLAMTSPEDLHSAFTPSYVMVLNLAARHNWKQCRDLVLQSFARYEKAQEIKTLQNTFKQLQANAAKPKEWQKNKTMGRLQKIGRELKVLEEIPWPDFERAAEVLMDFAYLDEQHKPTLKGLWAGDLRGDNIVFLAEVISKGILDNLTSYELCGFGCALSSFEVRWENTGHSHSWAITGPIEEGVRQAYDLLKLVAAKQYSCGLETRIPFTPSLIELGFDWASGYDWPDLVDKYRADEGDLVKALRQGTDLLKQIMLCPGSSAKLVDVASAAFNLMFRSPIKDEFN
jgi:superfamily II RNA helicase